MLELDIDMKEEDINIGKFLREKRNYLEYWKEFNIIKIIANCSFPTGKGCKVKCCREGFTGKITLAEYLISNKNIIIGFKKAEINYIFKWILENLREENVIIYED